MVIFESTIEQFKDKGEKTGWYYIDIPFDLAEQIKPNNKKAFRVKGYLDRLKIEWVSLIPMGEGNFIMAINSAMRKDLRKDKGQKIRIQLEQDLQEKPFCKEFLECLHDAPGGLVFFNSLPKSHQRYFSNWIETAKTDETKTKRIAQAVSALESKLGFGEMIRASKKGMEF